MYSGPSELEAKENALSNNIDGMSAKNCNNTTEAEGEKASGETPAPTKDVASGNGDSGKAPAPLGLRDDEFRAAANAMVEFIINYFDKLKDRKVFPDVKPGFMRARLPAEAPESSERWEDVFADVERVVMEGNTHWQSPRFFAFFAAATSYPSVLGEMLSAATSVIGFTWASSPSCTELEVVMMDWLGKALHLPSCFIHDGVGPGAGCIQGTASEATVITLLAARSKAMRRELARDPTQTRGRIIDRLVAYTSKYSHSSVSKAARIALVELRLLDVDENISLRGSTLRQAIEDDIKDGKIPLYVCATLGTTSCCSFDLLSELAPVCVEHDTWLHVDAAYAGCFFICPEFRYLCEGLELVTSFNFNPGKNLMVNFDCSALWVRQSSDLENSLNETPLYLQHDQEEKTINYMVALGRRFRSIKLWFVLRMFGVDGLREFARRKVAQAQHLKQLIGSDRRFELVFQPARLGLVCFRLVGVGLELEETNSLNEQLHRKLRHNDVELTVSKVEGVFFLRATSGSIITTRGDLDELFRHLQAAASELLDN